MDVLGKKYENLRINYLKLEELELNAEAENKKQDIEAEQLDKRIVYQMGEIITLLNEGSEQSKKNNKELLVCLLDGIDKKRWEDVHLISNLVNRNKISDELIVLLCKGINKILLEEVLMTQIGIHSLEWNKGSIIEDLIKLLNVNQERIVVMKLLEEVISIMDEEDFDNIHLLNASYSMLSYMKK